MSKYPLSPFDLNYSAINNPNSLGDAQKTLYKNKSEQEQMLIKLLNDSKHKGVFKIGEHGNKDVIIDTDSESATSRKSKGVAKLICISSSQKVITSKPLNQTREKLSSYLIKKVPQKKREPLNQTVPDPKATSKKKDYSIVFPGKDHSSLLQTSTSTTNPFIGETSTATGFTNNNNINDLNDQSSSCNKITINKHRKYNQKSNDPLIRNRYNIGNNAKGGKKKMEFSSPHNDSISIISHSKKPSHSKSSAITSPYRIIGDKYDVEKESDDNFERAYYKSLLKNKVSVNVKEDQGGKVTFIRALDFYDYIKKNQMHLIIYIQSIYRGHFIRSYKLKKIILIQSFWRQYLLRSRLIYVIKRYYRMNAFMNHLMIFKKYCMKRIKMLFGNKGIISSSSTAKIKKVVFNAKIKNQKQPHNDDSAQYISRNTRGVKKELCIETQKEIKVLSIPKKLSHHINYENKDEEMNHNKSKRPSFKIENNQFNIEKYNRKIMKVANKDDKTLEIEKSASVFIRNNTYDNSLKGNDYEKMYNELLEEMKELKKKITFKEFDNVDIDKRNKTRFEFCGDDGYRERERKEKMSKMLEENKQIEFTYEQVKQELLLNISKCNSINIKKDFPTKFTIEKMKKMKGGNITIEADKESSFKIMKKVKENYMTIKPKTSKPKISELEVMSFDVMIENDNQNKVKITKGKSKRLLNKDTIENEDNEIKEEPSTVLKSAPKVKSRFDIQHENEICIKGTESLCNIQYEHVNDIQLNHLYYQKPFINLQCFNQYTNYHFDSIYNHKPFSNLTTRNDITNLQVNSSYSHKHFLNLNFEQLSPLNFILSPSASQVSSFLLNSFNLTIPSNLTIKHFNPNNLWIDQSMQSTILTKKAKRQECSWKIEQIDLSSLEFINHSPTLPKYTISIQKQFSLNYIHVKVHSETKRKRKVVSVSHSQTDINHNNTFEYNTQSARKQLDESFPEQGYISAIKLKGSNSKKFNEIHNDIQSLEASCSPIPKRNEDNGSEALFQLPLKLNQMYSPQKKNEDKSKMTMSARFNRFIFDECFNQSSQRKLDFKDDVNNNDNNQQEKDNEKEKVNDQELVVINTEPSVEDCDLTIKTKRNTMTKPEERVNDSLAIVNNITISIDPLYTQEEYAMKILSNNQQLKQEKITLETFVNQLNYISNINSYAKGIQILNNKLLRSNNTYAFPHLIQSMSDTIKSTRDTILKTIIINSTYSKVLKHYYNQWTKITQCLISKDKIIHDHSYTFTIEAISNPSKSQSVFDTYYHSITIESTRLHQFFKILLIDYQKSLSLISCPVKLIHARRITKKIHTNLSMIEQNNTSMITNDNLCESSYRTNPPNHFNNNIFNTISSVKDSPFASWRYSPHFQQNKFKMITRINHKKIHRILSKSFNKWYKNSLIRKHKNDNDKPKHIRQGISIGILRGFMNKKILMKVMRLWKKKKNDYRRYYSIKEQEGVKERKCRKDTMTIANRILKRHFIHSNMVKCIGMIDYYTTESIVLYYLKKWSMGNVIHYNHHNQHCRNMSDINSFSKVNTRINYMNTKQLTTFKGRKPHSKSQLIPYTIIHREMLEDSMTYPSEDHYSIFNDTKPMNISQISLNDKPDIISEDDDFHTPNKLRIIKKVSKGKRSIDHPLKTKKMKMIKRYNNTEQKQLNTNTFLHHNPIKEISHQSSTIQLKALKGLYHISYTKALQEAFDKYALITIGKFPTLKRQRIITISRKRCQLLKIYFLKWSSLITNNKDCKLSKITRAIQRIITNRNKNHLRRIMLRWNKNAYRKIIINFKRIKKILTVSIPLMKARIKIKGISTMMDYFNRWAIITNLKNEKNIIPSNTAIIKMISVIMNSSRRSVLKCLLQKEDKVNI